MDPLDNTTTPTDIGMEPVKHHSYRMIVITLIVILVGIGGAVVLSNNLLKSKMKEEINLTPTGTSATTENETQTVPVVEPIANRAQPWVEIVQSTQQPAVVGQDLTLDVVASSTGKDITGYDVLIYIDRTMFDIVSVTSDLPNFSIYQFDKKTHLTVTGIKDLQDRTQSIFDNTILLKVVVRPKQVGSGTVSLYKSEGKEKTQLVDAQVTVIEPQIGSSQISIQ
ncbi:MAG: hypothetical protein ACEQSA_05865 [Weeksellaceae bacterium]